MYVCTYTHIHIYIYIYIYIFPSGGNSIDALLISYWTLLNSCVNPFSVGSGRFAEVYSSHSSKRPSGQPNQSWHVASCLYHPL